MNIRPDSVTREDIVRWQEIIDKDPTFPKEYLDMALLMGVCYAGCYLVEKLQLLECPEHLITRIQWTAGKLSFGKDPWEVHEQMLNDYIDNKLVFEIDPELN